MDTDLDKLIKAIEMMRSKIAELRTTCDHDVGRADIIDDAEMALGWAIKKLQKAKELTPPTQPA